jgi:hypothetical protein
MRLRVSAQWRTAVNITAAAGIEIAGAVAESYEPVSS